MMIEKVCGQCREKFLVHPSENNRQFCSLDCANKAQRTSERRVIICAECSTKFETVRDHGVWPKYCSRECFGKHAPQPTEKECPSCGDIFLATRCSHDTPDGLRIYCSEKCRDASLRNGEQRKCVNCGQEFYLNVATQKQRPDDACCSKRCSTEYHVGVLNKSWKGGRYVESSGRSFCMFPRHDRVGKYVSEHRVVAMRKIGRLLDRWEIVIRINCTTGDNKPENLFVCGTVGDYRKRLDGRLPWPSKSNLDTYK